MSTHESAHEPHPRQPDEAYSQLDSLTQGIARLLLTGRLRTWTDEETAAWQEWARSQPNYPDNFILPDDAQQ